MLSRGFLAARSGYLIKPQQRVDKCLELGACYSPCNAQIMIQWVKPNSRSVPVIWVQASKSPGWGRVVPLAAHLDHQSTALWHY